jgi:hypothetical protein
MLRDPALQAAKTGRGVRRGGRPFLLLASISKILEILLDLFWKPLYILAVPLLRHL